jgi:large subunit ribosomal protein L2
MRKRGGGHKRLLHIIDLRRDKVNTLAVVERREYDPNRSANIVLLKYADGDKCYILATEKISEGATLVSSNKSRDEYVDGMALPLLLISHRLKAHCREYEPRNGAQLIRAAGRAAQLVPIDAANATLRMPRTEVRHVHSRCRATIGQIGNGENGKISLGKAGWNRWLGRLPSVREIAMSPIDHPMGGGHGKTSGGAHPVSPWGNCPRANQLAGDLSLHILPLLIAEMTEKTNKKV